jgi:glycosyltransferase involved in cell wall biosynthesis
MKNILYTAFDVVPSPKGASTHITAFVRGLTRAGYHVDLLTPGDGCLPQQDIYEGADIHRFTGIKSENFLERAVQFSQSVVDFASSAPYPINLVHYRSIWGGLGLALLKNKLGYQTVFEVNGLPSIELKYHYPAIKGSPLLNKIREQELATLALSDAILCPSSVTRAFLVSLGVPRQRISVIPNGFHQRDFTPTPLPPRTDQPPTLLYIGTLADWQGLDLLIKAMPAILEKAPVRLRIVGHGRGRQRKTLLKKIQKMGLAENISLEDSVPHHQVPGLVQQADLCIAPLGFNDRNVTQGCCPIKVIEYMGAARPVVAANLPVVRELVREEIDGLLFTPDDPGDLTRQVLRVLQDPALAQRLSQQASERAHALYPWHEAQKKLLKLYDTLFGF